MASKSGGLGRGLGELFTKTDVDPQATKPKREETVSELMPDGSYFAELPVKQITPNPKQPRQVFDEDDLNELVASINEVGLLQPVVVRKQGKKYQLIMGERRLRAHQIAGKETIPAIVRNTDDADLLRDALLENLHRAQLNPLEEAAAYQQMLEDFGCSTQELADRIKRSRPHISNTIRLLQLPPSVQRKVAAGVLSAGHARALLSLDDAAAVERLAARIVAEGLSVRATEEAVATQRPTPARRQATHRANAQDPIATAVADRLSERLDTRVKVTMGAKKGQLTIDFADADDLQRILSLIEK